MGLAAGAMSAGVPPRRSLLAARRQFHRLGAARPPARIGTRPIPARSRRKPTLSGSTSYASFRPDVRTVDGAGFAAPTAEQMKTAFFVPALPSPAFLTARLDAVRPMLQVGSTRVLPSVPGVTFGDAPADPPSDLMTNPPADPPPAGGRCRHHAAARRRLPGSPRRVGFDRRVQVPINPSAPAHPTYSPRSTQGGSQPRWPARAAAAQPTQTSNPAATGPAALERRQQA
jgi:hypothetical protein